MTPRLPAAIAVISGLALAGCAAPPPPPAERPGVAPDVYDPGIADETVEDLDTSDFDALTEG